MKNIKFNVSMSCVHCQKRIEDILKENKGVKSTNVDLPKKQVNIEYDDSLSSEKELQSTIESLGFTVSK